MKIPIAKSCCCGCSLRHSSLIIAFLSLITSLGGLARNIQQYYEITEMSEDTDIDDPEIYEIREHLLTVKIIMHIYMLSSLIGTILGGVLLGGVFMSNRTMVLSWAFGFLGAQLATVVSTVIYCILLDNYVTMAFNGFFFIHLYFVWVVYSHTKQMEKRSSSIA